VLKRVDGGKVVEVAFEKPFVNADIIQSMLIDASIGIDQKADTMDILASPKIKSTTRLLQLTISDDERQRGLSFLGVIDIASPLCIVQMVDSKLSHRI